MKKIILHQYQEIVDQAVAGKVVELGTPSEGWIRTMRKALGMSGAQLGRRLGVSRAQIAQSEKNEVSGSITLRTLQNTAQAMGGRVVYAIVPLQQTKIMVARRAEEKAEQIVLRASTHMALEKQALRTESQQFEIGRIRDELLTKMPNDLWDDA